MKEEPDWDERVLTPSDAIPFEVWLVTLLVVGSFIVAAVGPLA